ncbi:unnamed protein product [Aphis gossypii]|nr:unnamed protein product [Aphis gossypii]
MNGKHFNVHGAPPTFSTEDEIRLLQSVMKCGRWGFPMTLTDLRYVAKAYLDRKGICVAKFSNNLPGPDWARSIIKRHKNLVTQRIATSISKCRAEVSPTIITEYFDNLQGVLVDIPPQNIFNYDESNLQDDPGKKKLIFARGTKYPERVQNHSKTATSIMICGSASGTLLPPYIIYKANDIWQSWTENGPKGFPCCDQPCCARGSRYNRTPHGWIDGLTFQDWFFLSFLPHAKRLPGKKVLIGDNLSSHIQQEVIIECEKNQISFVCLPKNSTHLTQPLDVGFFRPLKQAWRCTLDKWKSQNTRIKAIPKASFPNILKIALETMDNYGDKNSVSKNLVSAFRATGIYPLCREQVLSKLPNDNENNSEILNDTLTDYLKSQRYGNSDENAKKRRKKLYVPPGTSITTALIGLENILEDDGNVEDAVLTLTSDHESDHIVDEEDDLPEYTEPSDENIAIGSFVLVKVQSGKRKSTNFVYAAIIQDKLNNGYRVNGLKAIDTTRQSFKIVENDLFTVDLQDIIALLNTPKIETSGNRVRYKFSHSIDIKEA